MCNEALSVVQNVTPNDLERGASWATRVPQEKQSNETMATIHDPIPALVEVETLLMPRDDLIFKRGKIHRIQWFNPTVLEDHLMDDELLVLKKKQMVKNNKRI